MSQGDFSTRNIAGWIAGQADEDAGLTDVRLSGRHVYFTDEDGNRIVVTVRREGADTLTHARALQDDPRPWPGRDCPGELVPCGWYPDYRITHDGRPVSCTVATYHCEACDCMLAMEAEGGGVRNVYPFPPEEDEPSGSHG